MNTPMTNDYRVLVVDDDPGIREAYLHILRPPASEVDQLEALISGKAGSTADASTFEVVAAAQGEEAAALQRVALAEGMAPQVAFIDMRMPPGWDGLRTAVTLRAQDPSIYIVIATAFSDYDVNALQHALGHDVVLLRKPFNQEEVFQLARTLCQSWETRRRLEQVTVEMESRVQARTAELDLRVAQQTALAEIATRFVELGPEEDLDDAVHWTLTRVGRLLEADGCALLSLSTDQSSFSMTHEWVAFGVESVKKHFHTLSRQAIGPIFARLLAGETFGVKRLDDLPGELSAVADLLAGRREGFLAAPVLLSGRLAGAIVVGYHRSTPRDDGTAADLLRTAGHIVFRALEAVENRRRMRADQALLEATEHAAHIGNWSLDAATLTARWDSELRNILGIGPDAPASPGELSTLVVAEDWPTVKQSLSEAIEQGTPHRLEYRIQRPDGGTRWVYCWAEPERDGQGRVRSLRGMLQDITERKLAELALRQERDTTRNILRTVEVMIVVLDRAGRISLVNRKGCEILGYREEELLGRDWFATCLPDDGRRDTVREVFRKALAEDLLGAEYHENPVLTRTGEQRLIAWHNSTVRDDAGQVIGAMAAGEDITERRRTQDELGRQEALLQAAEHLSKLGGWQWNVERQCMFWTRECYALHDLDPSQAPNGSPGLIERSLACYPPEDRPRILAAFRRCVEEGVPYDLEFPFVTARGRRLRIRTTAEALRQDGRIVAVVGNLMDITEHSQTLDRLREIETIFAASPDGVALLDADYRYRIVNRAYEMFSGRPASELVGISVADYLGREVFEGQVKAHFDRCLAGETVGFQDWFEYPRLGRRFVCVTYFPYRAGDGPVSGVVALTRDVTTTRLAEIALRRSESRFRTILDQVDSVAVQGYGADLKVRYWNRASERVYGYSQDEALGASLLDLIIPAALRDEVGRSVEEMLASRRPHPPGWLELMRKDGSPVRVYSIHVVIAGDGEAPELYCLDIAPPGLADGTA